MGNTVKLSELVEGLRESRNTPWYQGKLGALITQVDALLGYFDGIRHGEVAKYSIELHEAVAELKAAHSAGKEAYRSQRVLDTSLAVREAYEKLQAALEEAGVEPIGAARVGRVEEEPRQPHTSICPAIKLEVSKSVRCQLKLGHSGQHSTTWSIASAHGDTTWTVSWPNIEPAKCGKSLAWGGEERKCVLLPNHQGLHTASWMDAAVGVAVTW